MAYDFWHFRLENMSSMKKMIAILIYEQQSHDSGSETVIKSKVNASVKQLIHYCCECFWNIKHGTGIQGYRQ